MFLTKSATLTECSFPHPGNLSVLGTVGGCTLYYMAELSSFQKHMVAIARITSYLGISSLTLASIVLDTDCSHFQLASE